jgi:hypothetical protein
MSAERSGWPTHKARARRARTERRRQVKAARAERRLAQRRSPAPEVTR